MELGLDVNVYISVRMNGCKQHHFNAKKTLKLQIDSSAKENKFIGHIQVVQIWREKVRC